MRIRSIASCIGCLMLASCTLAQPTDLLTVAERSDFRATARYDEVITFIDRLAKSSSVVRVGELGKSVEGRSIPLVILADPPVESAEQARKRGKLVVFAFGNIHAGEVCGKEALLMLAREIAYDEEHPLLEHMIVVLAPIYNTDGNERVSKDNRRGQVGPAEGMGERANAQGLDLNRDYVKLDSPEARALVRFYNTWDPAVIIDTHTTNGSHHQYTITYAGPRNPAGDPDVIEFVRDTMLPEVGKRLEAQTGYKAFLYGNFIEDHTVWAMHLGYPAVPRYGTVYNGMRNRIAILSEGYAYAPYKDRVLATRDFVRLCFEYAGEHGETIRGLIDEAKRRSVRAGRTPGADDLVSIRSEPAAADEPVDVLGYVEVEKDGRRVATEESKTYRVKLLDRAASTLDVRRPYAYIIPPGSAAVIENLQRHGIEVHELREDIELDVEAYRVDKVDRRERAYQNHHMVSVEATPRVEARMTPAGSSVVYTGQERAALLIHLLEPEAEDGLTTWNFFDDGLVAGADFPVVRLLEPVSLLTIPARPLPEDREFHQRITFERLYNSDDRPNLGGSPNARQTWLDDGTHYLENRDGELLKIDAETGRATPFFDPRDVQRALASLPTIDERDARSLAGRRRLDMNPARSAVLFNHDNDLYHAALDGSSARRLTTTPEPESRTTFSPDGRFVAFIRDYDLFVVDVETGTERALTTGGDEMVRNGQFNWVYAEELYRHGQPACWWSPDSSHISFLQLDDGPVHRFTVINEIPVRQETEVSAYPKAGDPNPIVGLGIVSAAGGDVRWVDLGDYEEGASLITRVGWKPDGRDAWFYVQDRAQKWLDFNVVSRRGGSPKRLFRETTGAWVSNTPPTLLDDGSILFPSERTGWRHLYHYDADGTLIGAVTSGAWEMRDVEQVDEARGFVYFSGTKDSHIQSHLYRVRFASDVSTDVSSRRSAPVGAAASPRRSPAVRAAASPRRNEEEQAESAEPSSDGDVGPSIERLTASGFSHRVNVDPTCTFFIDSWSNHQTPTQVALFRTTVRAGVSSRRSAPENPSASRSSDANRAEDSPALTGDRAEDSPALTGGRAEDSPVTGVTNLDRLVRVLDANPVHDLEEFDLGRLELVQIEVGGASTSKVDRASPPEVDQASAPEVDRASVPGNDDARPPFTLEGSILTPPDFDPTLRYPVWFMTYGGPHAPTISDSWSRRRAFDEMLANMGIIVFRCDPRSASGKGVVASWSAYRRLGVPELADIVDAIEWIKQKAYVDPDRIGMSGHSYGGFMTAYAMTHSKLFAAGIAGAPVTDWRNYDTIYTERYMDTPQENPEGYEITSVVKDAKNLHGRLLILHGVMDDNVHMQNTLQLVYELQRANKQFELMMYPRSRHGLRGAHYNRLVADFIRRTMGVAESSDPPTVELAEVEADPDEAESEEIEGPGR